MAWRTLPCPCCPGDSGSGGSGLCEGVCCTDSVPCDLCVEILQISLDSANPDCGTAVYNLPPPWIVNIYDSYPASPALAYVSLIGVTPVVSANIAFRTSLQCGASLGDPATWALGLDFIPVPPCTDLELSDVIADEMEVDCGLDALLGEHLVILSGLDLIGQPYDLTIQYRVSGGNSCGIQTACCDKRIGRILLATLTIGAFDYKAQLEWDGAAWEVTADVSGSPHPDGVINGTLTCTGSTWHGTFYAGATLLFDEDLTVTSCQSPSFGGVDGSVECLITHRVV